MSQPLPLAVYYEHPKWFRPLFAELDRRSIQYLRLDARCHGYGATATERKYALFVNRMSASAYQRGNAQGIFFTRDYLAHLERIGTRVINGCKAFSLEISKASQRALLHSLGAGYAAFAYRELRDPSCFRSTGDWISSHHQIKYRRQGAGIMRFDSAPALERAAAAGEIDFGIDSAALVQELLPIRGGHITRVAR